MKIAELASYVMRSEANLADIFPYVYSPSRLREALEIVEKVKLSLSEEHCLDDVPDENYSLSMDFTIDDVAKTLASVYTFNTNLSIDGWIRENKLENHFRNGQKK